MILMSNEQMRLDFHSAIKKAVMTKRPLIVVEGKDDLGIYYDLLNREENKFNIKPIEYFKGCGSGCNEIEKQVHEINKKYEKHHRAYGYFKGIVDSDAKPYRNEKVERSGILYLETYSFENSFVTNQSILETVKLITSVSNEQLDIKLSNKMIDLINTKVSEFYYITLEALKNAVVEEYDSLLGFSDGYERFLHDKVKKDALKEKYPELDEFAKEHNIYNKDIMDMKKFCKGKWHLHFFLKSLLHYLQDLHLACGNELKQCPLCEAGNDKSCLYKKNIDMTVAQLISVIKGKIENSNLEYVKQALHNLS